MHAAERKGFYDLHGEEALKSGIPDGAGGKRGGSYSFTSEKCEAIFTAFFGTSNPFEALEGATSSISQFLLYCKAYHPKPLTTARQLNNGKLAWPNT
jgi:DnaJ-class molecular chaperone